MVDRKIRHHNDLMAIAHSYRPSRLFLTAVELDIFRSIGSKRLTAGEVAARTGTDAGAISILLEALAALHLLEKRNDTYGNTAPLREDSSSDLTAYFRHQSSSWDRWSSLTRIVRDGFPGNRTFSREESMRLAEAMRLGGKEVAERLDLMLDFSGIRDICDMGCGPGTVCLELMRKHPRLKALLIDHDVEALHIAKGDATAGNIHDRIEIKRQDLLEVVIEKKFDMIIMSLVLCLLSREDAARLLKKAAAALRPGGTLILGETLRGDPSGNALNAALFAVHLLVMGSRGGLFSLDEIVKLLRDSGLRYERNFPTNQYAIIVGKNERD